MELEKIVRDTAKNLLKLSAIVLPPTVEKALRDAYERTPEGPGKVQLKAIIDNIEAAKRLKKPICQDTGVVSFYLKVGDDFPLKSGLKRILTEATVEATREVPLRPNAVEILGSNTGTNVGTNIPWVVIELTEGDYLEITAFPKGGGSTNVSQVKMLSPGLGMKGVLTFYIDSLLNAGAAGCPPYFVGVGIGGGENVCVELAKKALLRPIGVRAEGELGKLEEKMIEAGNLLKIGAMGTGEGPTVLNVSNETACRHPASLPVAIVFSCWALRYSTARVAKSGEVEYLTHRGTVLGT